MFTVKVLRPSMITSDARDEQLYEAREVSLDERGVLMQTENDTLLLGRTGYLQSLDNNGTKASSSNCFESPNHNVTVYVMNRYGGTVASYHF